MPFADHVDHGKALVATTTAPTSDALSRSECRELIEAQPKEEAPRRCLTGDTGLFLLVDEERGNENVSPDRDLHAGES